MAIVFIPARSSTFNSTVTFYSEAHPVDSEAECQVHWENMRELVGSLSDAIDELEELRALFSFFPFFLVLRLTCSNSTNGGAEVDDVSYAVGCGVVGGRGRGLGRLRRRRREISSISKWSYVSSRPPPSAPAGRPPVRPPVRLLDVGSVPPPPPPLRSMRAEKGS